MFSAALTLSVSVAIAFGLILVFVGPVSRRRPKVREALRLAWFMFGLALFSIVTLGVIVATQVSMALYLPIMLIAFCVSLWFKRRHGRWRVPKRV